MIKNNSIRGDIIKSLIQSIFTITIFSVGTRAFGFIYKIILSRILTTELLGILNISLSVFGVIATIICSGISITISRYVSINYHNKNKSNNDTLIFNALILTSILGIILSTLLIAGKDLLTNLLSSYQSYLLLICMIPAVLSNAIYTPFRAYLQGRELYFHSSLVELVEQILRIVVCFAVYFVFKDLDPVYSPVIAMSVAGILSTILGIFYFKKHEGNVKFGKPKLKTLISKSTPITLVKVLSSLVMPLVTIILPIRLVAVGYSSEEALSLLGIATGMTLPLLSVPGTIIGSLATALVPQISTLYENKENEIIHKQISSSIKFTTITTIFFVPIFIALGEPICELVFNNSTAGTLLAKASWVMIPMGISQITTTILNSMGYEKSTFINYIISTIFMAISIYFLPNIIGIESIIWAIGTSNTFVCIANIYKINKTTHTNIKILKMLIISIGFCIPVLYLTKYLYNILSYILPSIINICISGGIGFISLLLLFFAFGVIDLLKIKQYKFKKLKRKKRINA